MNSETMINNANRTFAAISSLSRLLGRMSGQILDVIVVVVLSVIIIK